MSKVINLSGTAKGIISIAKIDEPYGKESLTVASIGISLAGKADQPEWKVHIPLDNLDEVMPEVTVTARISKDPTSFSKFVDEWNRISQEKFKKMMGFL